MENYLKFGYWLSPEIRIILFYHAKHYSTHTYWQTVTIYERSSLIDYNQTLDVVMIHHILAAETQTSESSRQIWQSTDTLMSALCGQ